MDAIGHISGLSVPDIFLSVRLLVISLSVNEKKSKTMKRLFLILMVLTGAVAPDADAQIAVTDTICLTLDDVTMTDSVGLDEVVVKRRRTPAANSRWKRPASRGTGYGRRSEW